MANGAIAKAGQNVMQKLRRFALRPFLFVLVALVLPVFVFAQQRTATVLWVVDGDTLKINYMGKEENLRLIGIDTPESKPNQKAREDAERTGEALKTITAQGKKLPLS